ncbi:hypothetical protein [Paraliobacillus salinarum]|nr:hypothetical protein [Paraliobacillus salinarum]
MNEKNEREQFQQVESKNEMTSVNDLWKYANKNNTIPFDWSKLNK